MQDWKKGVKFVRLEYDRLENDGLQVVNLHGTWLRLYKGMTAIKGMSNAEKSSVTNSYSIYGSN